MFILSTDLHKPFNLVCSAQLLHLQVQTSTSGVLGHCTLYGRHAFIWHLHTQPVWKKYKGWWVWGWIKRRSQQWLMGTQPTCTVVRTYTEFAGNGNCWWLMLEGVGVLLRIGDIHYVSVLFCVLCQCGILVVFQTPPEWLE